MISEREARDRIRQTIRCVSALEEHDVLALESHIWNEIKAIMKEDAEQRRRNGKKAGGIARAAKLTPARRTEIARKAAQARWS